MTREIPSIEIGAIAYEKIAASAAKVLPHETGGILVGYRQGKLIIVTDALDVESTTPSRARYVRDDVTANAVLSSFLEDRAEEDPVGYVGEWHSHPEPVGPSPMDHNAVRSIAKTKDFPIALLVSAPGGDGGLHGVIARRQLFGRTASATVSVATPSPRFDPLGPLPDGAVHGDGPVFISYRQSDGTKKADQLEDLLRAAGLVVWRDHDDLRPGTTTDRLERALTQGLAAGVLVVTPDIVHSEIVRERELPRLIELDTNPTFALCIANRIPRERSRTRCDYEAPDRLLRLTPKRTLADKKQANVLLPTGDLEIVNDLLLHRIEQRKPGIQHERRPITIRIQSRPSASALDADETDLQVRIPEAPEGRLPSTAGLKVLQKVLPLTCDAIFASGAESAQISGGAHLSIGLALGAALPETRIGAVAVRDVRGNSWASNSQAVELRSFETKALDALRGSPTEGKNDKVAVFVTLTPHADYGAFERLIADQSLSFAAAEVISVVGTEHLDPRQAGQLSAALTHHIKQLASRFGRAEVHLAFHGPFPMAVLIGRHLNTLRTTVYEWDGDVVNGTQYRPTLVLEPGVAGGPIVEVRT